MLSLQSTNLQRVANSSRTAWGVRTELQHTCRRPILARGVKFSDEFMSVLSQALEREEQRIATKVGIPGLVIHEDVHMDSHDSTGSIIWGAGVQLARHLHTNRTSELRGARVLEIGAGTGIVGLTCATMGAHVLLTDTREVIPGTWDNVRANSELINNAGGSASVAELDWNNASDEILNQDFDWIFGADITYEEDDFVPLARLLRRIVAANPNAVTKIAHRHRSKDLDRRMREVFAAEDLLLRPVDVKTTGSVQYDDPIKVDEAIIFYRVSSSTR